MITGLDLLIAADHWEAFCAHVRANTPPPFEVACPLKPTLAFINAQWRHAETFPPILKVIGDRKVREAIERVRNAEAMLANAKARRAALE
jgi:hypothetical protein